MSCRFQTFIRFRSEAVVNVNRRLVELQLHGFAKPRMIFIVQGHKTKGWEAARSLIFALAADLGHTTNGSLTCLKCDVHEVTWFRAVSREFMPMCIFLIPSHFYLLSFMVILARSFDDNR
jgi:hypothetical protein